MDIEINEFHEIIKNLEGGGELSIKEEKYLKIAKLCVQLAAENVALKTFCKNAAFDADYEAELGMERGGLTDALNNIETPATDRIVAGIKADGVEMFVEKCREKSMQAISSDIRNNWWLAGEHAELESNTVKPPVHPTVASEKLDDETLQELIEFRRTTFEYHSKEGNKVQTIIHGVTLAALRELQERRKAALDSEPVAEVVSIYGDHEAFGEREIRPLVGIQQMPYGTKLYRHARPGQVVLKDHQIRELVNQLRDIAIEYHGTQQLRERIARVLRSAMLNGSKS